MMDKQEILDFCERRQKALEFSMRQIDDGKNYKIIKYGKAMIFDTEGDMHEYLTGHRSAVLDAADKKKNG